MRTAKRSDQGISIAEVMVAMVIIIVGSLAILPFFSSQKKLLVDQRGVASCREALDRVHARLASGGGYTLPSINVVALSPTSGAVSSPGPSIYRLSSFAAARSSLNSQNPSTFGDRFSRFGITDLYTLKAGRAYTMSSNTMTTDRDGVILNTPLLIQGVMSDLAELYDDPTYRGASGTLPTYLRTADDVDSNDPLLQMRIDRYPLAKTSSVIDNAPAGTHFWPIPRGQFLLPGHKEIKDPSQSAFTALGLGEAMQIGELPSMVGWDHGFKVTLSFTGFRKGGSGPSVDCSSSREYSYEAAPHNPTSFAGDIDIFDDTQPAALVVDTKKLSNKWEMSAIDDKVSTIFTNKSVNSADGTVDRPLCSQDGSVTVGDTRPFVFRLRFKNLAKSPGAIPMCLDLSQPPPGLRNADGSDYRWCTGGTGAEVLIKGRNSGGAQAGRQGWVPCEQLKICHETPVSVQVSNYAGSDTLEYQFRYRFKNDTNSSGSNLWGCTAAVQTAILDPIGNLTYVPTPGSATDNTNPQIVGIARPWMSGTQPFVYFKPPPCYTCTCKPCKKSKGIFAIFVAVVFVAAFIASGGLAGVVATISSALSTITLAGTLNVAILQGALLAALQGAAIVAGSTCMLQGAAGTGACGSAAPLKSGGGDYRACRDENHCSCGNTCGRLDAPDPYGFLADTPTGIVPIAKPFCRYTEKTIVNNLDPSITWVARIGSRGGATSTNSCVYPANSDPTQPAHQAGYGQTATWTSLDTVHGYFCQGQYLCSRDASGNPYWLPIADSDLGPAESCIPLKLAHDLTEASPGGAVTPTASPVCLQADIDKNLWSCTDFNCKAYNGSGAFARTNLGTSLGTYSNIYGRLGGTATVPDFTADGSTYFPVQSSLPNCGGSVLTYVTPSTPAAGTSFGSNIFTPDCAGGLTACPLSCTLSGTSCYPSTDALGNPHGTCTAVNNPIPTGTPPVTMVDNYSCTGSANSCTSFRPWTSWNRCTPPPDTIMVNHLITPTSGMRCFKPWSTAPPGAASSLNLCGESGGITNQVDEIVSSSGSSRKTLQCP